MFGFSFTLRPTKKQAGPRVVRVAASGDDGSASAASGTFATGSGTIYVGSRTTADVDYASYFRFFPRVQKNQTVAAAELRLWSLGGQAAVDLNAELHLDPTTNPVVPTTGPDSQARTGSFVAFTVGAGVVSGDAIVVSGLAPLLNAAFARADWNPQAALGFLIRDSVRGNTALTRKGLRAFENPLPAFIPALVFTLNP